MIKLIVCDFDGTLLPYGDETVSDGTILKIRSFLKQGICFAVSSGRMYSELVNFLPEFKNDIYFICDDGALTVKSDKVICNKPISVNAIKKFFDLNNFLCVNFHSLDEVYSFNDFECRSYGKQTINVKRFFEIKNPIYKISAKMLPCASFDFSGVRVHYNDESYYEFVSSYANKGISLIDLQLHLGINKYETVAVGDASNDIPMLLNSSQSFMIGEKSIQLKEICKYSVKSIAEAFELIDNIHQNSKTT